MKYTVFILCCILSTACTSYQSSDGLVEIRGTRDGNLIVRGMGVCIDKTTVFTSAHVVRDDAISYELRMSNNESLWANATAIERDAKDDIASMKMLNNEQGTMNNICNNPKQYIGKTELKIGESISILVMRSGSIMTLSGSITSLTGTILAYDTFGRTELMTGVLMTDISLLPGDSGAPILDAEGRVVDVVHIQ